MNRLWIVAKSPVSPGRTAVLFVCIAAVCLSLAGAEALMIKQDLPALAQESDDIVLGTVVGVESAWNAERTNILTTARVQINRSMRNRLSGTVTVTVPGGSVDGLTQWVEDQPVLEPGTEAYFFIGRDARWGNVLRGGCQGMLPVRNGRVVTDGQEKDRGIAIDAFDRYLGDVAAGVPASLPAPSGPAPRASGTTPVISGISPSTASAGTGTLITITGSGFGTKASRTSDADVGFLYRYTSSGWSPIWASGYPRFSSNSNDIVSWSDTRIVVRVPIGVTADGYQGGASSGFVFVYTDGGASSAKKPFSVTFSYGKRKWASPASFYINPGSGGSARLTAIQNALQTWNAAIPGSSFRLDYRGTSSSTRFGRDSQNLISFGPASDFAGEDGVIAWTSTWTDASGRIVEADVECNSQWAWTTGTASGNTMNVEAIVLHELGHTLALRDLYGWAPGYPSDVGKVMFGYNNDQFGNKNLKTLHESDRAGIRYIYGGATAPPPTVVSITPSSGARGSTVSITRLAGTGFQQGASVKLQRSGSTDIPATGVSVVSPTQIACQFALPPTAATGTWNVVVTNPDGRSGSLAGGFTVNAPSLSAAFSASPTSGAAPLAVRFTDRSTGAPTAWSWSFGDGGTSVEQHPSHTYASPGTYTVSLTVRDSSGRTATTSSAGLVTVTGGSSAPWYVPHVLPARIEAEDYDTTGPGTAYWDTTAANEGGAYRTDGVDIEPLPGGGYAVCYIREGEWTRYTVESPSGATYPVELRVSRWYDTPRTVELLVDSTLQATVTVPKTGGSTAYTTVSTSLAVPAGRHTVTLRYHGGSMNIDAFTFGSPTAGSPLGDAVDAPTLSWSSGGSSPWTYQRTVTHDGSDAARSGAIGDGQRTSLSTVITGPATVSWWWRTSSEPEYDHLFLLVDGQIRQVISGESGWQQSATTIGPGDHTVAWEYVKDGSLDRGSDCGWLDQVTLSDPADGRTADFGVSATCGRAPFEVRFTDGSTGAPTAWSWSFGDGATSVEQHPTHTYASNGFYTVTLRVFYADGATRTVTKEWFIHASSLF